MITLYDYLPSQNAYKVRLLLSHLQQPYRTKFVSIFEGEGQRAEYLRINPTGAVPAIELEDGRVLAESNAILWFLAEHGELVGDDPVERASILQWLFFEQHAVVPNIGAAYFWLSLVKGGRELQRHAIDDWMEEGQRALAVMDKRLSKSRYFCCDRYTIADIALYAYTHVAHECDFDLSPFPALRTWLARVRAEQLHVPMDFSAPALKTAAE